MWENTQLLEGSDKALTHSLCKGDSEVLLQTPFISRHPCCQPQPHLHPLCFLAWMWGVLPRWQTHGPLPESVGSTLVQAIGHRALCGLGSGAVVGWAWSF